MGNEYLHTSHRRYFGGHSSSQLARLHMHTRWGSPWGAPGINTPCYNAMGPHTQTGCRENGSGQTKQYKDTDLFNVEVEGTSPDHWSTIVDDAGTHHKQNHKPILVDIISSYLQCVCVCFYLFFFTNNGASELDCVFWSVMDCLQIIERLDNEACVRFPFSFLTNSEPFSTLKMKHP